VHAYTVGALVAAAMGQQVEAPDWDEVRDAFDRALAAEPEPERAAEPDTPKAIKMRALGLTGGGR
jgi:hypothetical protein